MRLRLSLQKMNSALIRSYGRQSRVVYRFKCFKFKVNERKVKPSFAVFAMVSTVANGATITSRYCIVLMLRVARLRKRLYTTEFHIVLLVVSVFMIAKK